ncbi:hypothetical protein D9M70_440670 [compost metagenome]
MDLLGAGLVLDQLQQVVAKHHRAFGQRQVLADLEGVHVDLAGHAAVVHQVLGQVAEAVEQALAAGFEEALDRRRVGHAVGRREGLGHQVDDEVAAADVLGRQVAVLDPLVQLLAPGQVGLHVAAVQRVLAPGRVGEAAVAVLRAQLGLAEQDVLQLQAEMGDVPGAVEGLLDGLAENQAGSRENVLAAQAHHRVEVEGAFRGLALQVFGVLVAHLRRSIVLRRIPAFDTVGDTGEGAWYCSGVYLGAEKLRMLLCIRWVQMHGACQFLGYPSMTICATGRLSGRCSAAVCGGELENAL